MFKSSPIRRCVRQTENYRILKTFLFFFKLRRFGGVGAPEGLENVADICTKFFRKISVSAFLIMARQYQNFPQNTKTFSKIYRIGLLAIVEG